MAAKGVRRSPTPRGQKVSTVMLLWGPIVGAPAPPAERFCRAWTLLALLPTSSEPPTGDPAGVALTNLAYFPPGAPTARL